MDRGLQQQEVAMMLCVSTDTVANWECGRNQPASRCRRALLQFLENDS